MVPDRHVHTHLCCSCTNPQRGTRCRPSACREDTEDAVWWRATTGRGADRLAFVYLAQAPVLHHRRLLAPMADGLTYLHRKRHLSNFALPQV